MIESPLFSLDEDKVADARLADVREASKFCIEELSLVDVLNLDVKLGEILLDNETGSVNGDMIAVPSNVVGEIAGNELSDDL
jgi:hypothetical protein